MVIHNYFMFGKLVANWWLVRGGHHYFLLKILYFHMIHIVQINLKLPPHKIVVFFCKTGLELLRKIQATGILYSIFACIYKLFIQNLFPETLEKQG